MSNDSNETINASIVVSHNGFILMQETLHQVTREKAVEKFHEVVDHVSTGLGRCDLFIDGVLVASADISGNKKIHHP